MSLYHIQSRPSPSCARSWPSPCLGYRGPPPSSLLVCRQGGHFPVARAAVDARVCASPGRDRDGLMPVVPEPHPSTSSSPTAGETSPQPQGDRKRRGKPTPSVLSMPLTHPTPPHSPSRLTPHPTLLSHPLTPPPTSLPTPHSPSHLTPAAISPVVSQNIAVSCSSTKRSRLGAEEEGEVQDGPYTITVGRGPQC